MKHQQRSIDLMDGSDGKPYYQVECTCEWDAGNELPKKFKEWDEAVLALGDHVAKANFDYINEVAEFLYREAYSTPRATWEVLNPDARVKWIQVARAAISKGLVL